jgi:hypothetical protein
MLFALSYDKKGSCGFKGFFKLWEVIIKSAGFFDIVPYNPTGALKRSSGEE